MREVDQMIFSINPDITPKVKTIGNTNTRIVVVKDFWEHPEEIAEYAKTCDFFNEREHIGLGNRSKETTWLTSHLSCTTYHFTDFFLFLRSKFLMDRSMNNNCNEPTYTFQVYDSVKAKIPHVDGTPYAAVCPLTGCEDDKSGTAFYRLSSSGEEYVTAGNYREANIFTSKRAEHFEEYHVQYHEYNTLIFYEGNLFHNAVADWKSDDKRLTFNAFTW